MNKRENWYLAAFVLIAVAVILFTNRSAFLPADTPAPHQATLVGYDEAGTHITDIWLHEHPSGAAGANRTVVTAHEGDQVAVLEQLDNGAVRVRTAKGVEGWTQIDSLKDIR